MEQILIPVAPLILIAFFIGLEVFNRRREKEIKRKINECKVGDRFFQDLRDGNPFSEDYFEMEIIEIRQDYARYRYDDGSGGVMSIRDIVLYFTKIEKLKQE